MPDDPHALPVSSPPAPQTGAPAILSRELGGDLPCISCGYNLRGLSIRSMCPECGTGVRATILSVVDPQAAELQPIAHPRLLVAGLLAWSAGAAASCVLAWLPHASDSLALLGIKVGPRPMVAIGIVIGVLVSAIGSLALVRPHARIPVWSSVFAALATALYIPLVWLIWLYHTRPEAMGGTRFLFGGIPASLSMDILTGIYSLLAAIILCQRQGARVLVARSLILRSGRVDRQTMYAIAAAAGFAALGVLVIRLSLWFASGSGELLRFCGTAILALSSFLITLGSLGVLLDSLRISQAILTPRRTLGHVISSGAKTPRSRLSQALGGTTPAPRSRTP